MAVSKLFSFNKTPDVSGMKFLFLGGLHRSGTSILHRVLQEHELVGGFSDTGVPEDEGQHLQSVFPAAAEFGGPGRFGFYDAAHLDEYSELISDKNRKKLLAEWGRYNNFDKKVFIEKSPPNLVRSRFLREMVPDSRFVFIVRHPIAVALATVKWQKTSPIELLLHWYVAHKRLISDLEGKNDFLLMRYEDFVDDPQFYLHKICSLVGISEFSPEAKVINHNDKYFRMWKEEGLDAGSLEKFFPEVSAFMLKFGYSLSAPYVEATVSDEYLLK